MTLRERIEAAAKGSFTENGWAMLSEETRRNRRDIVALYLTRAFPELFSVPPTGWIAPVAADPEMIARGEAITDFGIPGIQSQNVTNRLKPTEAKE